MAKDDLLKKAALQVRTDAEALSVSTAALAKALDSPPESKPEFPPGTLVVDEDEHLRVTTKRGLIYLDGDPSDSAIQRLATVEDVKPYAAKWPRTLFFGLKKLARLLVSQEPKPVLKGDDKEKYVVVEKRIAKTGESYVQPYARLVVRLRYSPPELPVWIVEPKDKSHGRQEVTDG